MKHILRLAALLLTAASLISHAEIARDKNGKIIRNPQVVKAFRATNPCPATGKVQKSCAGYIVDHIMPLCGYGSDTVDNLQYQTKADSMSKDKLELRQCAAIKLELKSGVCKK